MKIIGLLLGLLLGAGAGGFLGAMAGALLGWMGGVFLTRVDREAPGGGGSGSTVDLEKRLAEAQHAIEELRRRLERLEQQPRAASVATPPVMSVEPVAPTTTNVATAVANTDEPGIAIQSTAVPSDVADVVPPFAQPVEPHVAMPPVSTPAAVVAAATKQEAVPPSTEWSGAPAAPAPAPRAKPAAAAAAKVSDGPGLIERLLEGNIVAKLGVVILFFGVGFLLKFAYDRGMFPPQLRLLGVAAASIAMFLIGRRLMATQRTYAIVLMGGAMGLLYLDVFFALKTFALISSPLGFALFAALGVATLFLAVRMDARAFAVMGLTGAFMAPILASTGSGNHVLLFSYYLVLNLVILGASWFKAWRQLNFVGFLFTFAIALLWGSTTYTPAHFNTVEPFLIAFFLLYLAIPILFAQRQPPELKGLVDATLVFGMPLSTAMLQAALTRGMGDQILAWSALAASVIYAGLAFTLWNRERMRLLAEAHLALAIVFGTAAPYFAFEGYPTFAFWTLEGAAIFWMGCRQRSVLARAFALLLQFVAACYFWWVMQDNLPLLQEPAWLNDRVTGCGLIAAGSLLTAWFMKRFADYISEREGRMQSLLVGWGGSWLLYGLLLGICSQWRDNLQRLPAMLFAIGACLLVAEFAGGRLAWPVLRLASRAHAPLMAAVVILWLAAFPGSHPLVSAGVVAWPLSFAAYFLILHRQRRDGIEAHPGWRFAAGWALLIFVATWEALWRYDQQQFGWVWAIGVAGLVAAALRYRLRLRLREFAPADGEHAATRLSNLPLWWSLVWWFAGLHGLIETGSAAPHHLALHLSATALSILAFEVAGSLLQWPALRRTQSLLTLAMLVAFVHIAARDGHPFAGAQFLAWAVALTLSTLVLRRQEQDAVAILPATQHVFVWNLAGALLAWELLWRLDRAAMGSSWAYAAFGAVAAVWLALTTLGIRRGFGAMGDHAPTFRAASAWPLMVLVFVWTLAANSVCNGDLPPMPHLPVLNALDLAQLALLAAGLWAARTLVDDVEARRLLPLLFAAAAFFWLNAGLLRSVHQWADVPFELHALLRSVIAQAALSLLWTSTALVLMTIAVKRASRPLWMTGAALLALVVFKLFVNDLGNTGTVARIVSFIGVGVLLLVIGYVAPVPPRAEKIQRPQEES